MSVVMSFVRAASRPIRRSVIGNCALYVIHNQLSRMRLMSGGIGTESGMAHAGRTLDESLAYIRMVFDEYKNEAGVDRFSGRAAEVGPGDNCGVALLLLADGCDSVDLVDRFYSRRDESQHAAIYRALIDSEPELQQRFGASDHEQQFRGVERKYGAAAAAERFFRENGPYDLIISRAVMEHVRDPAGSLRDMVMALKPGGLMIHAIDLRDHGMFSGVGFSDTKFMEIPDFAWPLMTNAVGRPNRMPLRAYERALDGLPVRYTIKPTYLIGTPQRLSKPTLYNDIDPRIRERAEAIIRNQRKRFARSLRDEDTRDLATAAFFLTAQRIGVSNA